MITALMHPAQRGSCRDRRLDHRVWFQMVRVTEAPPRRRQRTGDALGDEGPLVYMAAPQPAINLAPRAFRSACSLATVSA